MNQQHQPRKRFGQNFLHDQNIIQKIASAIYIKTDDYLVEIGPGQGALTKAILPLAQQMTAIEIDRDLIPTLIEQFSPSNKFNLIQADALAFDFNNIPAEKFRLVGNLPYNISTPLLFHLMSYRHKIKDMHFMLQKEVVERICARPNSKDYGRLSVMIQYYCKPEYLFLVSPNCFYPAPKVDSAILRLTPYQVQPYIAHNEKLLEQIVAQAFTQRRKTIRNSLQRYINTEQLQTLGIDPQLRAENLAVEQWVSICNLCDK